MEGLAGKLVSAQRCYDAIAETDDVITGQHLWRAFARYFRGARLEAMQLELQGLTVDTGEALTARGLEPAGAPLSAPGGAREGRELVR